MNHIDGLRTILVEKEADALLLTSDISQRYAVDYAFSDGYVLITPKRAVLLTDLRYKEEAEKTVDPSIEVVAPLSHFEYLADIIETDRIRTLAYEDRALTCAALEDLCAHLAFDPIAVGDAIEQRRAVKDEEEIAVIRKAQEITDAAYQHILSVLTPEMTEVDVVLELEFFMRRAGADGIAFPTIAVSGASSALPHGLPSRRPLSRGFLTMDFGASLKGYASDMTRTVSIGKATPEMKRIYETVLHAQTLGMEAIAGGVPGAFVDAAARSYIDGAGYRGLFGHSFGHGVGLEIHEAPRLSSRSRLPLRAGNIVTAEPGVYLPGICGCRIENMGLVTDDGFDSFTKSSRELIELF